MTSILPPNCFNDERQCGRYLKWDGKQHICAAFPYGVPEEIAYGKNLHVKPYKGDKGKQFVQIVNLR